MKKKYNKNESIINFETLKTPNYMEEDVFEYDEDLLDYLNDSNLNLDSGSHNQQHLAITIKTSTSDLSIDLSDVGSKSITLKFEV